MNLVRRKRLPGADLWPGNRQHSRDTRSRERRSTDFKSIRKPDKIFYGERALMALTTKQALRDHIDLWLRRTTDLIDWPRVPRQPIRFQRDCDIARATLQRWETWKFRDFSRSERIVVSDQSIQRPWFYPASAQMSDEAYLLHDVRLLRRSMRWVE